MLIVSEYVPLTKLNEMALASVGTPGDTVVATAPELEMLTMGVPVMVNPVTVAVVQSVPPAALQVMFPVPKAMVRVLELVEENKPVVSVFPSRSSVPLVKVVVREFGPTVSASASRHVPPTPLKVMGESSDFPFEVIMLVPDVAAKVMFEPLDVDMPVESVKPP